MGEFAQKIVTSDKKEVLNILQCAYAEEWLSYYQYWIGAKIIEGIAKTNIKAEFEEHAKEELKHADWLSERIIQLGGIPIVDPENWKKHAKCRYEVPNNSDAKILVAQNLAAERCAIERYQEICELSESKDYETYRLSLKILKEELEHEQEMEDFQVDFNYY